MKRANRENLKSPKTAATEKNRDRSADETQLIATHVKLVYHGDKVLFRDVCDSIPGMENVILRDGVAFEFTKEKADLILKKVKSFKKA